MHYADTALAKDDTMGASAVLLCISLPYTVAVRTFVIDSLTLVPTADSNASAAKQGRSRKSNMTSHIQYGMQYSMWFTQSNPKGESTSLHAV